MISWCGFGGSRTISWDGAKWSGFGCASFHFVEVRSRLQPVGGAVTVVVFPGVAREGEASQSACRAGYHFVVLASRN